MAARRKKMETISETTPITAPAPTPPKPKRKKTKIIMGDTESAPAFTKAPPIVIDSSVERAGSTGGSQGGTIGDGTTFKPRSRRTRITTHNRPQGQGYTPRRSSR